MDTTADDNFFIEEPQNLRSNFFNRDKSMQIVELLAQNHHNHETHLAHNKKAQEFHPFSISFMMKKPEFKLNSADHIAKLLQQVEHTLDYRDHKSLDCLSGVLDDHFVELVKTDEYVDIIEHLSAYIDSQSALLQEIEETKSLLKPMIDLMSDNRIKKYATNTNAEKPTCRLDSEQRMRTYYTVDFIEL